MRLSTDQICDALKHDNLLVRDAAANYLRDCQRTHPHVTQLVIETIDRFGWEDALCWPHQVREFTLHEQQVPWVLEQMRCADPNGPDRNVCLHLAKMVADAPISSLTPHLDQVLAHEVLHSKPFSRFDDKRPRFVDVIQQRLEMHEQSAETCWNELFSHCKSVASVETFQDADMPKCERLIERLVDEYDFVRSRKQEVADFLVNTKVSYEDETCWIVGLMIILAGRMQWNDLLPHIYRHFELDWDWCDAEISTAMIRMGSEDVLGFITERYRDEPWNNRNFSTSAFERVHTDGVIAHISSLLEFEEDELLRANLGVAAASHFDDEGAAIAYSVFLEDPQDGEREHIVEFLVALSYLTDFELPDRDRWEQHFAEDRKRMRQSADFSWLDSAKQEPPTEIFPEEDSVIHDAHETDTLQRKHGRNSPCPCGSGKKFKKCCLRKEAIL